MPQEEDETLPYTYLLDTALLKARIKAKCTRRWRTKHSYWFTVPLSKQRMARSPPKLSVIFDFDIEWGGRRSFGGGTMADLFSANASN